jgi:hypothetical protein
LVVGRRWVVDFLAVVLAVVVDLRADDFFLLEVFFVLLVVAVAPVCLVRCVVRFAGAASAADPIAKAATNASASAFIVLRTIRSSWAGPGAGATRSAKRELRYTK